MCEEGDEFYEIPTGYRKVPGNICRDGVSRQLDP